MSGETPKFEGFAIIELMGHNTIAGYVSEQSIAGAAMLRVDVPACDEQPAFTKFLGGSAIYGITPTTEEIVNVAVKRLKVRPVSEWTVPTPPSRRLVDTVAGDRHHHPVADDSDNVDQYGFPVAPF